MAQPSRIERESHLATLIGTAAGRHYVMSTYKNAVGMPATEIPPAVMFFSQMIQKILDHEYAA
jgi:hypothetical protein